MVTSRVTGEEFHGEITVVKPKAVREKELLWCFFIFCAFFSVTFRFSFLLFCFTVFSLPSVSCFVFVFATFACSLVPSFIRCCLCCVYLFLVLVCFVSLPPPPPNPSPPIFFLGGTIVMPLPPHLFPSDIMLVPARAFFVGRSSCVQQGRGL